MIIKITKGVRFKQPDENGEIRCSIQDKDGNYIFSAISAQKIRPDLTEEYIIKKIKYGDQNDFFRALEEMPDYECWDSEKRMLLKEVSVPAPDSRESGAEEIA